MAELPTARDYLKSNVRLTVWCKACTHQIEMEFRKIVDQGKGDVLVVKLRFRCENCGSRLTDCVVGGSHLGRNR